MASNGNRQQTPEIKQAFLASAITDIGTYIQLADTKVSIIMGAAVALIVGVMACYAPIAEIVGTVDRTSWIGKALFVCTALCVLSIGVVFVTGILTIRGHSCKIEYDSKWYLVKSTKAYPFETYVRDVKAMSDSDIIKNMAAELYKLNDINRQKSKTMKWTIRAFGLSLIAAAADGALLLICIM